jgi:hypothetical protein
MDVRTWARLDPLAPHVARFRNTGRKIPRSPEQFDFVVDILPVEFYERGEAVLQPA